MKITGFRIDEDLRRMQLPSLEATESFLDADGLFWIDVLDPEAAELQALLESIELSGLSRRLFLESRQRSGFYPLRHETLLVIPALGTAGDPEEVDHVAILLTKDLVLTVHRTSVLTPEQLESLQDASAWLDKPGVAGLVSAMLFDLSTVGVQRTGELSAAILAMEERMEQDPDSIEPEELLATRSGLLTVGSVIGNQLPTVQALGAIERDYFKAEDAREFVSCALVNLQTANRALDWLDQRLGAIRGAFQMHGQDRTNRRLGMLTVISAIFMPITLLAGIWGMNFERMPELGHPLAYPIALGAMTAIGLGMFLGFLRRGWFD